MVLPRELSEEFKKLEINVVTRGIRPVLYTIEVQPTLIEEIQTRDQSGDEGDQPSFVIHEDGMLRFQNRVCILAIEELKKKMLDEGTTPNILFTLVGTSCMRM